MAAWSSVSFAHIAAYVYMASILPDAFKKVRCVKYKIKLKQSNLESNGKRILGFEHFLSQIRDNKKKLPLKSKNWLKKILLKPRNGNEDVIEKDLYFQGYIFVKSSWAQINYVRRHVVKRIGFIGLTFLIKKVQNCCS